MSVAGRVAVVAGADGALGAGIAGYLADQGAKVIGAGRGSTPADWVELTPGDSAGAGRLVQAALDRHGQLDIAVSAWDQPYWEPLQQTDSTALDDILTANLRGAMALAQAAAGPMRRRRYGRIILLSARHWLGGLDGAGYAAAKAGVVGLTRTLAWEVVKDGVTVNCVAPGLIQTPELESLPEGQIEELLKLQPVRRLGTVEEVAEAVTFLAADEASYITGQTLYVCGGASAFSALSA
ncbi:MAG: SDR family oxidoreductase [Chloroflexota bacterium]|nr:SDR family oxidoreductase [Chloroflexota bacterium]